MKPYYEDKSVTLYHGDSVEMLGDLTDIFDGIIADPPYTVGLSSFGESSKASGWGDIMNSAHFYANLLNHFRRILVPLSGSAWIFNSWRSLPILARASFESAWAIKSVLVWDKDWIGPGGVSALRPCYELAALFTTEGFKIENRSVGDVWKIRGYVSGVKPNGHPAEKPVALISRIIEICAMTNILDPFVGCSTTLEAAKRLGQKATGIEIEEKWCEVAAKRLSKIEESAPESKGSRETAYNKPQPKMAEQMNLLESATSGDRSGDK